MDLNQGILHLLSKFVIQAWTGGEFGADKLKMG